MAGSDRNEPGPDGPGAARQRALAAIARDYPPWRAWPGVLAGVLYARRPGLAPPMVVRSVSIAGLRQEIERAEHERGLRPMTTGDTPHSDLEDLRQEFAESGFRFGSIWASAANGPDARRLYASRDGVLLTAWNAPELRIKLRGELARE